MTKQQAFNRVWRYFVIEKHEPAITTCEGRMRCVYRGPGQMRCAIGALVPDSKYAERWDRETYSNKDALMDISRIVRVGYRFLEALQACHDVAAQDSEEEDFHLNIEKRLTQFAAKQVLIRPEGGY